ncbi:hypothetical protein AURDEDRAFT_115112 [Auricularia subglabra TFB-10046 SS5]|nr:hypothetical protein AURDEDRAFT_115112 [Auricularia subglabra TFB-10046 SS5]
MGRICTAWPRGEVTQAEVTKPNVKAEEAPPLSSHARTHARGIAPCVLPVARARGNAPYRPGAIQALSGSHRRPAARKPGDAGCFDGPLAPRPAPR